LQPHLAETSFSFSQLWLEKQILSSLSQSDSKLSYERKGKKERKAGGKGKNT